MEIMRGGALSERDEKQNERFGLCWSNARITGCLLSPSGTCTIEGSRGESEISLINGMWRRWLHTTLGTSLVFPLDFSSISGPDPRYGISTRLTVVAHATVRYTKASKTIDMFFAVKRICINLIGCLLLKVQLIHGMSSPFGKSHILCTAILQGPRIVWCLFDSVVQFLIITFQACLFAALPS